MIELILMLSLANATSAPTATAKVKPCVFPNTCGAQAVELVKVRPCVFPNTCGKTLSLAKVRPCVFPNTCGGGSQNG
ncbi:MAG TPA: hypothetical protein DCM05_09705 [Elusimicrobia bacterium]|nr:hypothetical protein [Elusimicrobiota bacterium]